MKICSVEDCSNKVRARGLCGKHYERWRNHGDVHKRFGRIEGAPCAVEGCQRKVKSRGYCGMHYTRIMETGEPGEVESRRGGRECVVPGCDKPYLASGYCSMHYWRWKKYGDAGEATPRRVANQGQCRVEDCGLEARSRFLCEKHLKRFYDFGEDGITRISERDQLHILTYNGAHKRTAARRGRADQHACIRCGDRAGEWAYQHNDPEEVWDERGIPYSLDPNHYEPMCIPCHRSFDLERLGRQKQKAPADVGAFLFPDLLEGEPNAVQP